MLADTTKQLNRVAKYWSSIRASRRLIFYLARHTCRKGCTLRQSRNCRAQLAFPGTVRYIWHKSVSPMAVAGKNTEALGVIDQLQKARHTEIRFVVWP